MSCLVLKIWGQGSEPYRLHQNHFCPLVATQKLEILLPFDEVTILGRTWPRCRQQADGGNKEMEFSLSFFPKSKLPGSGGRDLDSSGLWCRGTCVQCITSQEVFVTLSRGL